MTNQCAVCRVIEDANTHKLFEDEKCIAILNPQPSSPGHVLVIPKEHQPIIEQVPDFIVDHLARVANKISIAIFESLNAQGTNILINNGIAAGQESAHFMIHVIPRRDGDNLNFQWQPKQLNEEQVSTIEMQLKEESQKIGGFVKEKAAPIELKEEAEVIEQGDEEENYLVKHIHRIP